MTAILVQKFLLGGMPEGHQITITEATALSYRGFNVGWRDANKVRSINIHKMANSCFSVGQSLPLVDRPGFGPTCTRKCDFKASLSTDGKAVQLGEMTWQKSTIEHWYNAFVPGEAGAIELKFVISNIKTGAKATSGSITATPEKFHILQRPDNVKIDLLFDGDKNPTSTKVAVAADIGVDPPAIQLGFVVDKNGKFGMGFKQVQSGLDQIASLGVGVVLDVNKALIEWGVPGGAIILTAIELPETIDTAMSFVENSGKFISALTSGDIAKAHLYYVSLIKNGYDVGSALMNIKGLKSDVISKVVSMIPPGAKDLSQGVLTKLAERTVDMLLSAESGIVDPDAKRRRRRMARRNRYQSYA
ncbi:hypothetical protein TWF730_004934 [Orbilia blumenaviensis]|uniref:Uncharacterized protein n=1 Tax=Orbilia blumenaviensis TaxID=1796055 RepID=A0AAV9VMX6_9PEZI